MKEELLLLRKDIIALQILLPPRELESWSVYLDRAFDYGLISFVESCNIREYYGLHPLSKDVVLLKP